MTGKTKKSGFTLVELLVVVAIIALLLAILLPAMSKARKLAKVTVCSANLKQIGVAWHAYLAESQGEFPFWKSNMQWFYGGKHPSLFSKRFQLDYRPLNPYVDQAQRNSPGTKTFLCTDDREILAGDGSPGPTQGHATYEFMGNSYIMNSSLLRKKVGPARYLPVKLNQVTMNHSQVVMLGDCQWYYSVLDVHWDAKFHNDHDQVNLLFLDGHVNFTQLLRGEGHTADYSFAIKPEQIQYDDDG